MKFKECTKDNFIDTIDFDGKKFVIYWNKTNDMISVHMNSIESKPIFTATTGGQLDGVHDIDAMWAEGLEWGNPDKLLQYIARLNLIK